MLQNIRDRATGPVAWGIILLLMVPFALWGINSYFDAPSNPVVAKVGDAEITRAQLQRAYDESYQRLQSLLGENFSHELVDPRQFKRNVLEEMIQSAMLDQYVDDSGFSTSDQAVGSYLRSLPVFQVDGRFSVETYRAVLAREGLRPAGFEADVRRSLEIEQLRTGLLQTAFVTPRDIDDSHRLQRQRRQASYLQFDAARYLGEISPGEAEIKARYETEQKRFFAPERLRLDYVELDRHALPSAAAPEDELLRALYEAEKQSRFASAEERRASHILVRVGGEVSESQGLTRVRALREQLVKGADFAALAREHSDDTASRSRGGALEPAIRGTLDPAFEAALYKLKSAELSEPVRTAFGWHLIRLDSLKPAQVRPFTDPAVRGELLALYRERELDERYRQLAEKLDELSFENAESLQPVASALGLKLQQSDWLQREGGPGIGGIREVVEAAYSEPVLQERVNSAPIKAGADRLIVLRIREHEAPRQRSLAEVRQQLADELRAEQARRRAQKQAEAALARLRQGQALAAVAADSGAVLQQPGWIGRDAQNLPPALIEELFRMPRPEAGKPVYASVGLADGAFAVIGLEAVAEAEPGAMTAEERQSLAQTLTSRQAAAEFEAFKKALRKKVKVRIYEDQL